MIRKKTLKKKLIKKATTKNTSRKSKQPEGYNLFGAAADKTMSKRFKAAVRQGRKPAYSTPFQMQKVICEYFDECYLRKAAATIGGLALALGISRQQLRRYESKTEIYRALIKTAKRFVENSYEELLIHGKGSTPGVIFALKQLNWTDKQEIEYTGQVAIIAADEEDL